MHTIDTAAMIVASTLASAACGRHIESAKIIRDIEVERGGRPDATLWFEPGDQAARRRRRARQRADERCGGVRRQRSAQHRACRHAADGNLARHRREDRRLGQGRAGRHRHRLRGGRPHRRGHHSALRLSRPSRLHGRGVRGHCRGGAAARPRRAADGTRDRADGDLHRRRDQGGGHQRVARVPRRRRHRGRHRGGAWLPSAATRASWRCWRWSAASAKCSAVPRRTPRASPAISARAGTSSPTWPSS